MPVVSLLQCDTYDNDVLKERICRSLALTGFDLSRFRDARVVVKPNLLMPAKEDKAIVTHPEFFRAVIQIVRENGGMPILVESPAVHSLERAIKKSGYADIVESEGVTVADPAKTRILTFDGAKKFKHIDISEAYFDADIILNLPKFKTHGITYITGAVKLLFGAIPGLEKSKMHLRCSTPEAFSEFLLDLYGAMNYGFSTPKPIIHLMDAIAVQEGEGPGPAGIPRRLNAVLAGENGIAVDYVAAMIAGLDVNKALTVVNGFARDYGVASPDEISVLGETVEAMRVNDFVPATGGSIFSNMFRWPFNTPFVKNLLLDRPVPKEDRCTLCYQCRKICASGAISESSGRIKTPVYDYNRCIRCFCCLEICPEAAIEKQKGRLQWVLGG
ncbi:MAG: DUF362 domain-containing protein [Desulfobacteraceae bacterium]|nr:DUF362 domain-containing protein [Desulfobacteraceae bacterium]